MKNSKLVSIVLIVIISLSALFISKDVFAAENILLDITNNSGSSSNTNVGASSGNNTAGNNTASNSTTNKTNTTNAVLTTGNNTTSTKYNNTSLPSTGIEDSVPGVILVVVLGISAVYAFNKIKYYKDI